MNRRILVTGGAGFIGSSLALALKRDHAGWDVVAFDNLKRRGSELSLGRLRAGGVDFVHGDVRCPEDLEAAAPADVVIECSAEPSVHAGYGGSPAYVINANLVGAANCLEHARRHGAAVIFLSTSRVYPIHGLRTLPLTAEIDRYALKDGSAGRGWSKAGINEDFPSQGSRSIYGATKLAAELLIEEYRAMYGLKAVINRCGAVAGPWQMGKVDQGFVVLWLARHLWGGQLNYMGFGGEGLQVRDILHVEDLIDLVALQLLNLDRLDGQIYNVGGGASVSVSLRELTARCERLSGNRLSLGRIPETRPADVPWYVSDIGRVAQATGWRPRRGVDRILEDTHGWLLANGAWLRPVLEA